MLSLNPKRIIFNPGTENPEFEIMAREKKYRNPEWLYACAFAAGCKLTSRFVHCSARIRRKQE